MIGFKMRQVHGHPLAHSSFFRLVIHYYNDSQATEVKLEKGKKAL